MEIPYLDSLGLTKTEAALYQLLLETGEIGVGELIKKSALKRATVYKSLYQLQKKGLVSSAEKEKKIHFKPESPQTLFSLAETKYKELGRAQSALQSILPQLTSQYTLSVERPVVTTFEGVEGLKKIYEDTLKVGKPIYALVQTAEVEPVLFKWLTTVYVKKRAAQNIHAQVIVSTGKWSKEYVEKNRSEDRSTILVSEEQFPFEHEVDIYGDKVAFIHYKKGEKLIGIVIDHPAIAKTMKAMFDLAWLGAQGVSKQQHALVE